jgi:hypothetical protein
MIERAALAVQASEVVNGPPCDSSAHADGVARSTRGLTS